jgi:thymidylate synthase
MLTFENFTDAYLELARIVRDEHEYVSSPRGMKIKEKLGVRFEITNPRKRILNIPSRKFKIQYMIAESLWYFSGSDKTEWIANYAPFWRDISDDGITANSAYGSRIFTEHHRIAGAQMVQWDFAKKQLLDDPDSRRAVIHIKTSYDSLFAKKDVPCTLALQFFVRNGKLDMVANMRSSDLILGIAYDVPAFTLMQERMANELGIEVGRYIHVSNSLHVYEKHFEMLDEIIEDISSCDRGAMPHMPESAEHSIVLLTALERGLRFAGAKGEIEEVLNRSKLDDYWHDWLKILAGHRALKIGEKSYASQLARSVDSSIQPIRRQEVRQ